MPLDLNDPKAVQWKAANGKYNSHNIVHRFRFYRFSNRLSLFDVMRETGIPVNCLVAFERLPHMSYIGRRIDWSDVEDIVEKIEALIGE